MNSSLVRQPIASAMLGLIPCFVNSPRTSAQLFALLHFQVDVFHPVELCFRLGRKASVPGTVGDLGKYQDGTGFQAHGLQSQAVHGILHSRLLCVQLCASEHVMSLLCASGSSSEKCR